MRAKEVIGRRRHILAAADLKETIGLRADQQLVLLLFDSDPILERLWDEATHLIPEIVEAQYDAVVAPSYSIWLPRPRTEYLYQAKRSLIVYHALQLMKAVAVPRVAWVVEHDVRRWAEWARQPGVETVALDLMTYRRPSDWSAQMTGLALFDVLTGRHLKYLINGPTTLERFVDLYACVAPARVSVTNATLAALPESAEIADAQLEIPLDGRYADGPKLRARSAAQRKLLRQARRTRGIRGRL